MGRREPIVADLGCLKHLNNSSSIGADLRRRCCLPAADLARDRSGSRFFGGIDCADGETFTTYQHRTDAFPALDVF
jgi:hypothetical protein